MRTFALEAVKKLREAGFTALWAGGCVRDLLLGTAPHDYDVATDATTAEVRKLFRRTLAVGAQFGVIEVLGPEAGLHVQVATFRSDGTYSDGRHPDSVRFGTAEEDAQRRDFTINGLFYDPIAEQVIDYVGGRADLVAKIVRAIGVPSERIREDKLRMLRAIRFVARLGFTLDEKTADAIAEMHSEFTQVSAERITDELKKILVHSNRMQALELFVDLQLLTVVLPEYDGMASNPSVRRFALTRQLPGTVPFPLIRAALLLDAQQLFNPLANHVTRIDVVSESYLDHLCKQFRYSNAEREDIAFFLQTLEKIKHADKLPWSELKPLLADPRRDDLISLLEAACKGLGWESAGLEYARARSRGWSSEQLNPALLVRGEDVAQLGVPKGPHYKELLDAVRKAQLNDKISTREEALLLLRKLAAELLNSDAGRTGN